MIKMHFFTDEAPLSYGCFGWWLSDLVDIPQVDRIPKTDVSIGVTCGQESRLDSEGSVPSGHQQNKTDVGQITFDFTDNTTINKHTVKHGNTSHQTEQYAPPSPITADTARTRTRGSKITAQDENTFEIAACSKQQLAALIYLPSPNHKRLQKLLDQGSPNKATLTNFGRSHKISTASDTSIICVSDLRTRLQNYWTSPVEDDDKGLSPVEKLALSIEHDPGRKLEESRCALMQAFRELDSRVRGLQEGASQLQTDVNRLKKDFEVCGSLHIKYTYIPASLIFFSCEIFNQCRKQGLTQGGGGGGLLGCGPPWAKFKKNIFFRHDIG
jgi:hypothetical protein